MLIGILIAIVYTLGSIVDLFLEWREVDGGFEIAALTSLLGFDIFSWRLFVVAPLWILVILISIIAIWIGYSMLTSFGIKPFGISLMKEKRLPQSHWKNWKKSSQQKKPLKAIN